MTTNPCPGSGTRPAATTHNAGRCPACGTWQWLIETDVLLRTHTPGQEPR